MYLTMFMKDVSKTIVFFLSYSPSVRMRKKVIICT